jgi:invasion protein IalB
MILAGRSFCSQNKAAVVNDNGRNWPEPANPGAHMPLLIRLVLALLAPLSSLSAQRTFEPESISYTAAGAGQGRLRGVEVHIDFARDSAQFRANGTVWNVSCAVEEETRQRTCSLTQQWRSTALTVRRRKDGTLFVRVGEERSTFLGTDVLLRVDDGITYITREPGWNAAHSAEIVKAMRGGTSVMTAFIQWPSADYIDAHLDLAGFDVAMEFMEFAVQ